ncbi:MAG: hypothetical protein ACTHMK_13925 [Dyella sp.]|uniref:hypothetical protein n=1 Tax=Dyella sp. TaxID=1869338 RepID=UPI003F80A622
MTHPTTRKLPTAGHRFCYGRVPCDDGRVSYRLFRRAMNGRTHYEMRSFRPNETRSYIARELNIARHQLRNTVDEIDLGIMGVTNA